eukprot:CAMPEP_0185321756 /NCGR_PEP_ID=MMETSP1363-20130426/57866_1 /TAXON_ID=38817 /ORGANISM="Gephyrocapsa oceanica, Strain RCC1303" /LENGTH=53 /DNA_ID=CAMNT_0027920265 /DNA_START=536 /DNA_END=694 /DNA_ORIENTATION=+
MAACSIAPSVLAAQHFPKAKVAAGDRHLPPLTCLSALGASTFASASTSASASA